MAPDPSLLNGLKTETALAGSTEEQGQLAVPLARIKYRCAIPAQGTNLAAKLAFPQEIILVTGENTSDQSVKEGL